MAPELVTAAEVARRQNKLPNPPRTGWPPGMLQDDSRELSKWFASKPDARRLAREAAAAIGRESPHAPQSQQA